MRVAPANPGGKQMLNQGLTVTEIAAVGTVAKPADTITLAPLVEDLQPDDVPVVAATSATAASEAVAANTLDTSPIQPPVVAPADVETPVVEDAPVLAQDSVDAAIAAALAEGDETSASPNESGAISAALRPMPRPADLGGIGGQDQTVAATPIVILEKDPSTIPVGAVLAQFGAFETPQLARAKFGELVQNLGGLMAGKAMVVLKAETTGRTIYRLRAYGLTSDADANSFCAAVQAQGTECVPVAQR
jgi:hypothetical protein